jgi:enamine deaminase RidA (YjgF/YER057c/UK114 family)
MMSAADHGMPVPQGRYVPAKRHGNLVFTAGMTPRKEGILLFTGRVTERTLESCREPVALSCLNALLAVRGVLQAGEEIASILSLTVYIAAEEGFTSHARLADYASQFLFSELGERGIGSRAAIGVATLPGNAPVEVQIVAAISPGTSCAQCP